MRLFVIGATGYVGSALVPELIAAGHSVIGLARSDEAAEAHSSWGAEAYHGDLTYADSLRAAGVKADAVIHTAFNHGLNDAVARSMTSHFPAGLLRMATGAPANTQDWSTSG